MTDELVPQPTVEVVDPSDRISAEELVAAGDIISKALLFSLRRNYLDGPIFEANYVRLLESEIKLQPEVTFLHLEQVGKPVNEDFSQYLTAIQTTLAATHDPRYSLLFVITSDGLHNDIYVGVCSKSPLAQPNLFANQLGQFLCANWPGTRVNIVQDYNEIISRVHVPLSNYRYARALTGIPSPKTENQAYSYPQSMDQLMRGLRGKPYVYLVIADPMPESAVNEVIDACRTLSGQVHAFTKATIQQSASEGTSTGISRTETESESTATSRGTTDSTTEGESKGVLGTSLEKSSPLGKGAKVVGSIGLAGAIGAIPGGVALLPSMLGGMLGMFGQLLPSATSSKTSGTSQTESETFGRTFGTSETEGTTTSESLSFGREYLNKHAEACEELLAETVTRFEIARGKGCWDVGVYLISDQAETAAQAQAQLKALVSGEKSSFEPVRIHDLDPVWDGQVQVSLDAFQQPSMRLFDPQGSDRINHPLGQDFEGLTTLLNTEELSLLANLPLRETPGMPVQPTASFSLNPPIPERADTALVIGQVLEGGEEVAGLEYAVDINTLTRHVFITGITGSGKSNTCRRIIAELMERDVNFMVIEPAKDEYVQLALGYNQASTFDHKIAVYAPGRKEWSGHGLDQLRLNPFDVVRVPDTAVQVMPHLDRLKSIFNASFPMQEILPVIMEEALVDLYDSQGWLEEELPPEGVLCPTLEQLYHRITELVRVKGYEQRITDNITAAMRTRIGSLMRGWKGKLFNHPNSTPWADLFDRPVVVNLQQMGDDADKSFTMALLLNFMYEYRQAQYESLGMSEQNELHHLALFEEAHRILRAAPYGQLASPQAKMGEMFADILAEIRAYGQGLGIVDQVPSKLVPDAIKNTNLKIVHRLVASDDRQTMAGTLALSDQQTEVIARLKVGQAIVAGVQDDEPSWTKIFFTPLPQLKKLNKK
jgi:hypothetical protein